MSRITPPTPSRLWALLLLATLGLGACATQEPTAKPPIDAAASPLHPERATGLNRKSGWTLRRQAVAAANPLAAQAGAAILRAGGSATDAAVAVQMVLTLVEPQSSGIGGGAFLLSAGSRRPTPQTAKSRPTTPRMNSAA